MKQLREYVVSIRVDDDAGPDFDHQFGQRLCHVMFEDFCERRVDGYPGPYVHSVTCEPRAVADEVRR